MSKTLKKTYEALRRDLHGLGMIVLEFHAQAYIRTECYNMHSNPETCPIIVEIK